MNASYGNNVTFGQQSTLSSPHLNGKEGGTASGKKLGTPLSNPIRSASPNVPTLSPQQKEFLSNNTEETFEKARTPFTNQSISPPPNDTASQINQTNTVQPSNKSKFDPLSTNPTLSALNSSLFHRFAYSVLLPDEPPENIRIYVNKTILPSTDSSNYSKLPFFIRNEPSVASNGRIFFCVGNWYAARSIDGGSTWKFRQEPINSTDQIVLYDSNHHIFIWYRQGFRDGYGENKVTINISPDALNWWTYVVSPTTIFGPEWKHKWIDFPHLALTRSSLYLASNIMESNSEINSFNRTFIMRIPVDDLSAARNPSFTYYFSEKVYAFAPVQGAMNTDTMYWAAHLSNDRVVLYKWQDSEPTSNIIRVERNIPAWTPNAAFYSCPTFDNDWCLGADDRITSAWISHETIGFGWNVDKGGGFPWPYVNIVMFNASSLDYLGRPVLWSKGFAWQYADITADSKGNLGMIATFGGNNTNPSIAIAVASLNDTIPKWQVMPIVIGGKPEPWSDEWGDYLTIRPYSDNQFIASAYTVEGIDSDNRHVEPRIIVFGMQ